MKISHRIIILPSVIILGLLFSTAVMAYNVTIGDFGGAGNSTNGSFVGNIWTPTGDSNLDSADLLAEISGNDVEVITSTSGNITITDPFVYSHTTNRQLSISASGNIVVSGIVASSTGSISVVLSATELVTVNTTGLVLNGGSLTSSGTDFNCTGVCVQTIGGDVNLDHNGGVSISDGGIITGVGSFTSSGIDFASSGTGVHTVGGNITLNHSGGVTITDGGIYTASGSFSSFGTDFNSSGGGVLTNGSNVTLKHSGNVKITDGGIITSGGSFSSSGNDFHSSTTGVHTIDGDVDLDHNGVVTITDGGISTGMGSFTSSGTDFNSSGSGIQTNNGSVTLDHNGNVIVIHNGVNTGGGDFTASCSSSATFSDNGVFTNGGNILVSSNGIIDITPVTTFISGGTNDGGDISLRSETGITIDSFMSTTPGSGGLLSLTGDTNAISLNQPTTLGTGNITLFVGSISCIFPWAAYLPAFTNSAQK